MTVQEQILDLLREKSGAIVDAHNVAERVGDTLNVPAGRVRDALFALQARGLVKHENIRTAALTEAGWGANGNAEPESAGSPPFADAKTPPTPVASPPATPVQQAKSSDHPGVTKGEEGVTMKTKSAAAILTFLREQGGIVRNEQGLCATDVRSGAGLNGTITQDLAELDALGLIRRTIRGKRTFAIELTPVGIDAARSAAKGATNGDVQELRGGDRVVPDGERARPARRKTRAPARAKAVARRGRKAGKRKRAPSGRRGRAHGDGARVDEPLRDVQLAGTPSKAELEAFRALVALTPEARSRVIDYARAVTG